jgi:glycosyltransferase involved in cell wall biosynthesis
MPVDYSIIIPAYNEESYLADTLTVLQKAMMDIPLNGEIIVTDNNSTDRTAEIAKTAGAKVVFEPVNQISRARNTGARHAEGRYLVMYLRIPLSPFLLGPYLATGIPSPGYFVWLRVALSIVGAMILRHAAVSVKKSTPLRRSGFL